MTGGIRSSMANIQAGGKGSTFRQREEVGEDNQGEDGTTMRHEGCQTYKMKER